MEFLKKFTNTKLVGFAAAGVLVFATVVALVLYISRPNNAPLYAALSPEDTGAIAARLQAMSIPYKIQESNNQIEVAADKVLALRMTLAQEGLPSAGRPAGYELFDKSDSLGTSQFVYNVNLVRALEGELSKTIATLAPVHSARVHLVLPKRELFSKSAAAPSASIVLKMKGSRQLSKSEIAAVAHIVASAVPDLALDHVTIIDDKGNPLKLSDKNGDYFSAGGPLDSATEYKINLETRLTRIIEELLMKSVGPGKIKATVSADVDFDREVINYETYDTDGQVIRSQRTISENDKDGGLEKDVSVANNIPNAGTTALDRYRKEKNKSDNLTNYEISKRIGNKITEQGKIRSLSVAILVDGVYENDASGKAVYQERSEEEMLKFKALAASAIGFDPERGDRIELVNLRFAGYEEEDPKEETLLDWIKGDAKGLIQTIVIGIVVLLSILVLTRSFRKLRAGSGVQDDIAPVIGDRSAQQEKRDAEENSEEREFDIISPDGKRYNNVSKYLNNAIDNHFEESLAVIKSWLYK